MTNFNTNVNETRKFSNATVKCKRNRMENNDRGMNRLTRLLATLYKLERGV